MNQITLLGRMTKDPELRYTDKGTAVARFTIAVSRDHNDKTDFLNCLVFGKQAESTAQYCKKGRQVLVSGRLEINVKTDEQNNQVQRFTQVIVSLIKFLQLPKQQQQPEQQQNQQSDTNQQSQSNHQQRFQPGPNGWQDPNDTDNPF